MPVVIVTVPCRFKLIKGMTVARLTEAHWQAIRAVWEYDPIEPVYELAAKMASEKHGFIAPSKQAVRMYALRHGWERRGSLVGINAAAQRKADALMSGKDDLRSSALVLAEEKLSETAGHVVDVVDVVDKDAKKNDEASKTSALEQSVRTDAEDVRAQILARHRAEWPQVAKLRQEALNVRAADPAQAFNRAKLAKITSEITAIQQAGERKAWGMDVPNETEESKTTIVIERG